jgi:hypothetical protein
MDESGSHYARTVAGPDGTIRVRRGAPRPREARPVTATADVVGRRVAVFDHTAVADDFFRRDLRAVGSAVLGETLVEQGHTLTRMESLASLFVPVVPEADWYRHQAEPGHRLEITWYPAGSVWIE